MGGATSVCAQDIAPDACVQDVGTRNRSAVALWELRGSASLSAHPSATPTVAHPALQCSAPAPQRPSTPNTHLAADPQPPWHPVCHHLLMRASQRYPTKCEMIDTAADCRERSGVRQTVSMSIHCRTAPRRQKPISFVTSNPERARCSRKFQKQFFPPLICQVKSSQVVSCDTVRVNVGVSSLTRPSISPKRDYF
jgi:hypothetical protein